MTQNLIPQQFRYSLPGLCVETEAFLLKTTSDSPSSALPRPQQTQQLDSTSLPFPFIHLAYQYRAPVCASSLLGTSISAQNVSCLILNLMKGFPPIKAQSIFFQDAFRNIYIHACTYTRACAHTLQPAAEIFTIPLQSSILYFLMLLIIFLSAIQLSAFHYFISLTNTLPIARIQRLNTTKNLNLWSLYIVWKINFKQIHTWI